MGRVIPPHILIEGKMMKSKIISLIFVVAIVLSVAISSPVFAWGISPAEVTFNVSANGSVDQYFNVTDINGSIMVSMEGIPLSVNPSVVDVDASGTTKMIKITINGDESLGEQTFSGTIDFLPRTNASVAFGIKVLTTVHQFASASQLEQNPIPTATAN